jgi:hypothetical protein
MLLPKYIDTNKSERIGVHKVAYLLSEMGLIFRETSNSDTGIDGQVEEVDENNNATGRIMAVQIKSGRSYLHDSGDYWKFYVDEAHKNYWRLFPIPVILLVYNPKDDNVYFIDAKYALNTTGKIEIPKNNILNKDNKEGFFKTIGGSWTNYNNIEDVFRFMLQKRNNDISFSVSYLELFISGLTNLCHDLFYDVSLATDIADYKSNGVGFSVNHEFLWNYITYIVKENLAVIDFHACLYDWEERMLQPRFIAPLTFRGRQLLDYITQLEYQNLGNSDVSIVCESFVNLQFDYYSEKRLIRLSELQSMFFTEK